MKNLKKILSLVLVLVMAMSLVTFASAADLEGTFTDLEDANPAMLEAIDVMVSLGIIGGRSATTLAPKGTITRAEIAKIATYLKTGAAAAERLVPQNTKFSDVPASHWASKYIAYLTETGIIAGRGDGTFDPEAAVTGVEIGKILLGTLGYGVKSEYVGNTWSLNVIADASRIGIFSLDTSVDLNAPATREQVIQYAFNTMATNDPVTPTGKNYIVEYSEFLKQYVPSGGGGGVLAPTANLTPDMFIGPRLFGLAPVTPIFDDFGFMNRQWTQYGAKITGLHPLDYIIDEFTVPEKLTKNDLAQKYTWDTGVIVWTNGVQRLYHKNEIAVRGDMTSAFGAELVGAKVYFISGASGIYKVIIKYETLAKVTRVNAAAGTINVDFWDPNSSTAPSYNGTTKVFDYTTSKVESASNIIAEGYAVGDFVLLTLKHDAADEITFAADGSISSLYAPTYSDATTLAEWKVLSYAQTPTTDPFTVLAIAKADKVAGTVKAYTRATAHTNVYLASVTTEDGKIPVAGFYGMGKFAVPLYTLPSAFILDSNGSVIGWDGDKLVHATYNYLKVFGFRVSTDPFATAAGMGVKAVVRFGDTNAPAEIILPVEYNYGTGKLEVMINGEGFDIVGLGADDDARATALAGKTGILGWYSYSKNEDTGVYTLSSNAGTKTAKAIVTTGNLYDFFAVDASAASYIFSRTASGSYFTTKTTSYVDGVKNVSAAKVPHKDYSATAVYGTGMLLVTDPDTREVIVSYAVGGFDLPPAATMFAILDQPYSSSTSATERNYTLQAAFGGLADDAIVIEKTPADPARDWKAGDVVLVSEIAGEYVISKLYDAAAAMTYVPGKSGGYVASASYPAADVIRVGDDMIIYTGDAAITYTINADTYILLTATNTEGGMGDIDNSAAVTITLWVDMNGVVVLAAI